MVCSRMIRSQARQRTTPSIAGIGPSHDPAEEGFLRVVELGRRAWRRDVDETVRSLRCIGSPSPAMSGGPSRRIFAAPPRSPVEYGRKRQKPSRLRSILCASRKPLNVTAVSRVTHCSAHGKHPPFAILNHVTANSGIP